MPNPAAVVAAADNTALIVGAVVQILTLLISGLIAWLMAGIKAKAETAEQDRVEVKKVLAVSTATAKKTMDETLAVVNIVHTLTNNDMRVALQAIATLSRKIAQDSGLPEDISAADRADRALLEHDVGQRRVDADKREQQ